MIVAMTVAGSARGALLFRGRRRRHGDVAEGSLHLDVVEAGAGARPGLGTELDVPVVRPIGHDTDNAFEIGLGVEPVELTRGNEREEVCCSAGVVIAAEEQPILSTDGDGPERSFGTVI